MMKKYVLPWVFLCLFVACVERPLPPPGTLSQEMMTKILIDIHIAEAKTGHLNVRSIDSSQAMYKYYEGNIFKKYKVDTAAYRKSFEFYLENTDYLDEIYQAVVDSLSVREKLGKID